MKPFYTLFFLLMGMEFSYSQSLFNNSIVHKIEIDFFDSDWDQKLDSLASLTTGTGSGTGRILANVTINGTLLDSCGVRYKGNSSMDTTSNKNPFNIDLNYVVSGQEYQGKDKIKLANCFADPSMLREALSYELANRYMDCPRASFVELHINGEYRGIYTNTESVDNEFLDQHYGSSDNPFFKCDPNSFELYGDNSNLAFHPDTMVYDTLYDMKSDYGLEELQALTYQLEYAPATIGDYMDVDRALWFLAISSALVHNDGYTAFGHNYYVYKMDNGKWSIVLWDVNMSFGGLLWNGTNLLPLNTTDLQEQDPFLHQDAYDFRPLIAHLLSNPQYKRMYTAHFKTIMQENIENGYYMERAETMHDLISPYVATEPYSHYSFADFNDNLYNDVGFWFDLRPGLENLMEERATYVNEIGEFTFTAPTIDNISHSPATPEPFTTVNFTVEITEETAVYFNYRFAEHAYFITEAMYDDGMHGDGAAGDGIYGIAIPMAGTEIHYYIYAENSDAGRFSPVRAAYEYYTLNASKPLVINEILADNNSIATDINSDYDDWIELYNNSDETLNLEGYFLSDDPDNPTKWAFPNTSIAAGDYLIVWADDDSLITEELHTNFKLSAGGEFLLLSNPAGDIIDQIDFPDQFEDITYGRIPNGTGPFDYLYPTFNAENTTPVHLAEEANYQSQLTLYPNPAKEALTIQSSDQLETVWIHNLSGELIQTIFGNGVAKMTIDINHLSPGIYIISNSHGDFSKLVVQ